MSSDALAIFLLLAAAAFAVAAYLLWSHRGSPDSATVISKENNITAEKSGGSRIGACISLAALALVAQIACSFVYTLLFGLSYFLTYLPEFLVYVLAFAFYPLVLGILLVPLAHFIPWAAACAERICPTRKGLRYTCIIVWDILCVITNVLPCITGSVSFSFSYVLPLLYAAVFWFVRKSLIEQ